MDRIIAHDCRGIRCAITPGVIDDNARHLFTSGQCHSLAMDLARKIGCDVGVLSWAALQDGETLNEMQDMHIVAVLGNDRYADVNGIHTHDQLEAQYCDTPTQGIEEMISIESMHPDDLMDYLATGSDGLAWGPVAHEAAASMSDALIEQLQLARRPELGSIESSADAQQHSSPAPSASSSLSR